VFPSVGGRGGWPLLQKLHSSVRDAMFNLIKSNYTIRTQVFCAPSTPQSSFSVILQLPPTYLLPLDHLPLVQTGNDHKHPQTGFLKAPTDGSSNQLNDAIGQVCVRFSVSVGPLCRVAGGVAI
jgi:hypothetical protein